MSGIYWGSLACLAEGFDLVTSLGTEPAVAHVRVERSQVEAWALRVDPERFRGYERGRRPREIPLPDLVRQLTAQAPVRAPRVDALPYRADLIVAETGYTPVSHGDFFLSEVLPVERDGELEVFELVLGDVRKFWADFGVMNKDFNVRRGIAADGTPLYVQRTLKGGREPWTPREVLQEALWALPGAPTLAVYTVRVDERPIEDVRCMGASPLDVLESYLAERKLVLDLRPDGQAAVWTPGVGALGERSSLEALDNDRTHDLATGEGAWAGKIPDAENGIGERYPLDAAHEVLVTGPPPIYTAQVDYLVPVVVLEIPDGVRGGAPLRLQLDVTPSLLQRIAPAAATATKKAAETGAKIEADPFGDVDPFAKQPVQDAQAAGAREASDFAAQVRDAQRDPLRLAWASGLPTLTPAPLFGTESWLILRLPLVAADEAMIPNLSTDLVEQLRRQIGRLYRLPDRQAHYGPILDRAERDRIGERVPVTVEAFGWREITVSAAPGLTAQEEKKEEKEKDERTAAELELDEVTARLADVRRRLKAFAPPTMKDLAAGWAEIQKALPRARELGDQWVRDGKPPNVVEIVQLLVSVPNVLSLLARTSRVALFFAAEVLGQDGEALDPERGRIEELQRQEKTLLARQLKAAEKADPARAIEIQIKAKRDEEARSEKADLRLAAEIEQLHKEHRKALASRGDRQQQRVVTKKTHMNVGRHVVPARVRGDGLIELERPAGWLADPNLPDPRATFLMLMPVRATFGTRNLAPPTNATLPPLDGVAENVFVNAAVRVAATDSLLSAALLTDLGHVLPVRPSPGPLVLTFSRQEGRSGKAEVGPFPLRVTVEDLQAYYGLPNAEDSSGADNFAEVLKRASEIAAERLSPPQVRLAGTFTVDGPRPVGLNGLISGVRWQSDAHGLVDTVVSLEPPNAAFPDTARAKPAAPRRTFGIDVERLR